MDLKYIFAFVQKGSLFWKFHNNRMQKTKFLFVCRLYFQIPETLLNSQAAYILSAFYDTFFPKPVLGNRCSHKSELQFFLRNYDEAVHSIEKEFLSMKKALPETVYLDEVSQILHLRIFRLQVQSEFHHQEQKKDFQASRVSVFVFLFLLWLSHFERYPVVFLQA